MQSQSQREQSWRIRITAKGNNFNFALRFIASIHKPTWTFSFFSFSFLLNLPKFVLRITSHPTQPTHGRGFFTAKFMKIVHKFRHRFPKKRESNHLCVQGPVQIGFWVMGFLAFLAQSINKNDQRGIVILAFVGPFLLLLRKLKIAKFMNLAAFGLVVVVTLFCYHFLNFDYNYWDLVRYAWNKMVNL
ncbi:hypothetical protein VNO77_20739 [Canavalia gladiata]|uniref:Uncharacterized protein n=1 Tax=Canavalia gladiata TaxID=3824 RepID=A0AAN9LPY4_CANGL